MFTGNAGKGTEVVKSRTLIEEEDVASEDRLRELEEKYEDYKVYDNQGEKIGKVDDLFVDESDREEYIGVKMGFLGMKSTLIPMEIVRVNEGERSIGVSDSKHHVKSAPSFDDDEDITPDYEVRIRSYFGLDSIGTSEGGYGAYSDTDHRDADDDTREYEDHFSVGSEEHTGSTTGSSGNASDYGDSRESSGMEPAERGSSDRESSDVGSTFGGTSPFTDDSSGSTPTTRETEETETFREGGRTKIRRRVIREEIIEEDDNPDYRNL
jgi:sporulation protein YlmC with PRC-barrel domain